MARTRGRGAWQPPPRWQPKEAFAPFTFATQAWLSGLLVTLGGSAFLLPKEEGWGLLMEAVCLACMPGGFGGYEALVGAGKEPCVLSKKPSRQEVVGAGWMGGAIFEGRDGYWQVSLPHPARLWHQKEGAWQEARAQGLPAPSEEQVAAARRVFATGVHHLICWWAHGAPPAPTHACACHWKCGNRRCLNPHHISWGSHKDNCYHREAHKDLRRRHTGALSGDYHEVQPHPPRDWVSYAERTEPARKGEQANPHAIPYRDKIARRKQGPRCGRLCC